MGGPTPWNGVKSAVRLELLLKIQIRRSGARNGAENTWFWWIFVWAVNGERVSGSMLSLAACVVTSAKLGNIMCSP